MEGIFSDEVLTTGIHCLMRTQRAQYDQLKTIKEERAATPHVPAFRQPTNRKSTVTVLCVCCKSHQINPIGPKCHQSLLMRTSDVSYHLRKMSITNSVNHSYKTLDSSRKTALGHVEDNTVFRANRENDLWSSSGKSKCEHQLLSKVK